MNLDMSVVMKEAIRYSKANRNCFKLLPDMACHSKFQIGAVMSQSFSERMNSVGKVIFADNRTLLDADIINKLVVLRMNKRFIEYCRQTLVKKNLK